MKFIARILAGGLTLFFLGMGLSMLFNPTSVAETLGLQNLNPLALSTIRGVMGGSYTMISIFLAIAVWRVRKDALLVAGVYLAILIFARILSAVIDGTAPQTGLAIMVESIFLGVVIFAYIIFQRSEAIINET